MSMYDLVLGDGNQGRRGVALLDLIGNPDIGRFRDAWLEKDAAGTIRVAIYTRNGGGNRECWEETTPCTCPGCVMAEIPNHPLYLSDQDDDFDETYATIYFRLPDPLPAEWEFLNDPATQIDEPVDTDQRWAAAIDALKKVT